MSNSGTRTGDFVILGGGVMGASIAFHLAQGKPSAAPRTNLEEVLERACRRVPSGKKPRCCAGSGASTIGRPTADPCWVKSGLHVCAGFSGMGFKISPAVGLVMSELLLYGAGKTVNLSAFRPGRFAEGKPIRAEFEYVDD